MDYKQGSARLGVFIGWFTVSKLEFGCGCVPPLFGPILDGVPRFQVVIELSKAQHLSLFLFLSCNSNVPLGH